MAEPLLEKLRGLSILKGTLPLAEPGLRPTIPFLTVWQMQWPRSNAIEVLFDPRNTRGTIREYISKRYMIQLQSNLLLMCIIVLKSNCNYLEDA